MENKGKQRVKFNFFDIILIAALTLFIVLNVYFSLMTEEDLPIQIRGDLEYTLKIESIDLDFANKIKVGDEIFEYESGKNIGKIKDIVLKEDIPGGHCAVTLTIVCSGALHEDLNGVQMIFAQELDLRVGSDIRLRNTEVVFQANLTVPQKAEGENEEA